MMVFCVWSLFLLWLSPNLVHAETLAAPGVTLIPAQVVAAGPFTLSPPALRYDAGGTLHVAWQEKPDQQGVLKVRQIAGASRQLGSAVQVNPATLGPEALHQAPGLATGGNGTVALSWSTPNRTPAPCSHRTFVWRLPVTAATRLPLRCRSTTTGCRFPTPSKICCAGLRTTST